MIQLSLSLGVLGRKKTEFLQGEYLKSINQGDKHEDIEDKILEAIQDRFAEEIESYCNRYMIYSNMKVAEDIVKELRQLTE